MTKPRFGKRSCFVFMMAATLAASSAWAQKAEPAPKPGKPINAGDVLSGELNAMKGSKRSKRARPAIRQRLADFTNSVLSNPASTTICKYAVTIVCKRSRTA